MYAKLNLFIPTSRYSLLVELYCILILWQARGRSSLFIIHRHPLPLEPVTRAARDFHIIFLPRLLLLLLPHVSFVCMCSSALRTCVDWGSSKDNRVEVNWGGPMNGYTAAATPCVASSLDCLRIGSTGWCSRWNSPRWFWASWWKILDDDEHGCMSFVLPRMGSARWLKIPFSGSIPLLEF